MTNDEKLADSDVEVSLDGVRTKLSSGARIVLKTGESITLPAGLYHTFWAEKGKGPLIVGELSKLNDDTSDNCLLEKVGRFPEIEEECSPVHYLCNEYPI